MEEVSKRDHSWCLPLLPYTSSVPSTTALGMWRAQPLLLPSAALASSLNPAACCASPASAKGIAAAEAHAHKLELLKAGTPSQARAALDLNPPVEIISVTLQAVSGFILEFIKFQCHPYS